MTPIPLKLISDVRMLIKQGWVHNAKAVDRDGDIVPPMDKYAERWDLLGAIERVSSNYTADEIYATKLLMLRMLYPTACIPSYQIGMDKGLTFWNDALAKNKLDVLYFLDKVGFMADTIWPKS